MADKEIVFNKYKLRGANYHYSQIKKLNLKSFNAFSYARYIKHISILEKRIKKNNLKKVKILDFGCGDGVLIYLLLEKIKHVKFEVYGIDVSEEAISVAKKKIKKGSFSKQSVYNTSFESNFFDFIISSDVIEHVKEPEKMIKEMKRVLRHNAEIIIGTPIRISDSPLDKMHVQEFFVKDFENLFIKNKLELLFTVESHDLLYYLLYNRKLNVFNFKFSFFRYLVNLFSIISFNPFLSERKNKNTFFTYMTLVIKK